MSDLAELQQNLAEYNEQLQQVEEMLAMDPQNSEYVDLHSSLVEVIQMTQELLQEAQPAAQEAPGQGQGRKRKSRFEPLASPGGAVAQPQVVQVAPPSLHLPGILPPQVAEQIRAAQQKAALTGQGAAAWGIGARCQALYSGDGEWYNAVIKAVTVGENFLVVFDEGSSEEEVLRQNVRPRPEGSEIYRGVQAPRRKVVGEPVDPQELTMPEWMDIKENDDEKTKERKRKMRKTWKSKQRFARMDAETEARKQGWQNFKKGKGAKKKAGFFTGKQKGSMFSVPDNPEAKVGVVNSGNPMTEYKSAGRFSLNADGADEV